MEDHDSKSIRKRAIAKVSRYVLMARYDDDHWGAICAYDSTIEAQIAAKQFMSNIKAWRIVEITNLPIMVAPNEA